VFGPWLHGSAAPLTAPRRARAQAYTYHGQQRDMRPAFLAEQDIVITTYSTLAQELKSRTGLLKARPRPHGAARGAWKGQACVAAQAPHAIWDSAASQLLASTS